MSNYDLWSKQEKADFISRVSDDVFNEMIASGMKLEEVTDEQIFARVQEKLNLIGLQNNKE